MTVGDEFDVGEVDDFDSIPLVPDQGEDEGDFTDPPSTFRASIGGRDWTVETLVSQMRKGRINLDPSFQRRNAWLGNRKSKLLESIMLGFPIPQIVLAETPGNPGHFFVLDGKQRLLALRQFFVDPTDERDAAFTPLRLTGLEVLPELNRKDLATLEKTHASLVAAIENHSIRTVALTDWNSERLLLSLFLRLNTGSVALSPQELRQALVHGEFTRWLDEKSGDLPELRRVLNNEHPDRRMVDAELLLRHLAFSSSPIEYRGNLKQFLDDTSKFFNSNWQIHRNVAEHALDNFARGLSVGMEVLREGFARKWSPSPNADEGRYERALNRAVFDVQVHSLSFEEVRRALPNHAPEVIRRYRESCETNDAFVRAISATTKTVEAFVTRHRVWQEIISETTGVEYPLPTPLRRP
ncbi:DUF262 domain-containing protein [Cellulosimicrobium sp. NPDC055967]|uniref:DUF262 domain-containing protein n=1 Tax=Cellulosimicrobium sp. NPDC055967 TaxID=3345670 RepID=UPI0035DA97D2